MERAESLHSWKHEKNIANDPNFFDQYISAFPFGIILVGF